MSSERERDHRLAKQLAEEAGRELAALRDRLGFEDPGRLRAAGDQLGHSILVARLGALRPDEPVLSEEGADDPARLTARRVWIVDPLDGTREFAESQRFDWAVHVALWEAGSLVAGAVALPAEAVTLTTLAPPALPVAPDPLRIVASRTRQPDFLPALANRLGAEIVPMGSAGAKMAAVARGHASAYVHAGGQYEWDSAAPSVVAEAVGLHVSRLDGTKPVYNQRSPYLPDLVICRPEIADVVLQGLAEVVARPTL